MLGKFIKSFRSKYGIADFGKSQSQMIMSDNGQTLNERETSKRESESSEPSMSHL